MKLGHIWVVFECGSDHCIEWHPMGFYGSEKLAETAKARMEENAPPTWRQVFTISQEPILLDDEPSHEYR
jgi:hypothetical protein